MHHQGPTATTKKTRSSTRAASLRFQNGGFVNKANEENKLTVNYND